MKKYTKYIVTVLFIILLIISLCFIPVGVSKMIPQIEGQISDELGIKVHIDKLILRGGPYLKLKSPVINLMYNNGQSFGRFNNIKFYISWFSLFKHKPEVCKIYANGLELDMNSDDKDLPEIIKRIQQKEFGKSPDIYYKEYKFIYNDKNDKNVYLFEGNGFSLSKMPTFKNWHIKTDGNFYINNKKYLNVSVDVKNKYDMPNGQSKPDFRQLIAQLKALDFYSDIISDLTIYKNNDDIFQASGFVNIDNISILDKDKKCPKSFIYATLWGDKARISSNIYTAKNKKVYIDGMISNSKKSNIDLKVKTDEIELNDLYKKIKVLSFFTKFKELTALNGKLEADFVLKGDLSKIKSNGYFKISDANIDANGILIEQINSDIDLSNNKINIKNASGMVKKAPITAKGSIDKNINIELNMDNVPIRHLCPENYGVKDGIITMLTTFKGTSDSIVHKEKIQIKNLKIIKGKNILSADNLSIDTNQNNKAYITNLLYKSPYAEIVKIPLLTPEIDKDKIKLPVTKVYMPNSQFNLYGNITDYSNKNILFDLKLDGRLYSKDIKKCSISEMFPVKFSANGNRESQNYQLQLLLEKANIFNEPSVISAFVKKEKNNIKIEEISTSDYSGNFSEYNKKNPKNNKKIILTGVIENYKEPVLKNVRFFVPQPVNINLFDTVAQLKGDIFLNGQLKKPEIIGQICISNLFNHQMQLSVINSIFDFNKNSVNFNIPGIKISDFVIVANGTISTENILNELNIKQLNLKSKYVNTDTFLMYKDLMRIKNYPIAINEAKFYIEKMQATLYASPVYMSAVSGDFKLKNNLLMIRNLTAEAFNGKLSGKMDYHLRDDVYAAEIIAKAISASQVFAIISDKEDVISGAMDLDAQLMGALTSKNAINGNLKFIVHNGRMSSMGRLEHLLYAQNVIADNMLRTSLNTVSKAITLKDTGLFKYLRGAVTIKNGVADIHYLQSQGPLMALFIKGQYNLNDNTAILNILGRLSDEVTNGLGAFGEFSFDKLMVMLTGEENRYKIKVQDLEMLPQLTARNTKEFYSLINGNVKKPASVLIFNWISCTEKSLRQKDVPMTNVTVPSFVYDIPY